MITKQKKDFNNTMESNRGMKKGDIKISYPSVTCGAFGDNKILRKKKAKKRTKK